MSDLRAVVVIDYQNVHLTAHDLFPSTKHKPRHESLLDPLLFAQRLLTARNRAQETGRPVAVLRRVLVYRGMPAADHDPVMYARSQAQRAQWERDRRVEVTLRPLKYDYQRDDSGRPVIGPDGKRTVVGKREKGVDVLCALALVREARRPDVDLVVLASHDSDLEPALDEVLDHGEAKVETFAWFDRDQPHRVRQLRPGSGRRVWNTRLGETDFNGAWDPTNYS
jgi:hypothetical protein